LKKRTREAGVFLRSKSALTYNKGTFLVYWWVIHQFERWGQWSLWKYCYS